MKRSLLLTIERLGTYYTFLIPTTLEDLLNQVTMFHSDGMQLRSEPDYRTIVFRNQGFNIVSEDYMYESRVLMVFRKTIEGNHKKSIAQALCHLNSSLEIDHDGKFMEDATNVKLSKLMSPDDIKRNLTPNETDNACLPDIAALLMLTKNWSCAHEHNAVSRLQYTQTRTVCRSDLDETSDSMFLKPEATNFVSSISPRPFDSPLDNDFCIRACDLPDSFAVAGILCNARKHDCISHTTP